MEDNGQGISISDLENLKTKLVGSHNEESASIGIANILHRLQLLYNNSATLKIDNNTMGGVTVKMSIPYNILSKGSDNNESSYH